MARSSGSGTSLKAGHAARGDAFAHQRDEIGFGGARGAGEDGGGMLATVAVGAMADGATILEGGAAIGSLSRGQARADEKSREKPEAHMDTHYVRTVSGTDTGRGRF